MFKQFTNGNGYFIGVDLAERKGDLSVSTIMRKHPDGTIEVVESSIIGGCMSLKEQELKFKEYEKICDNKTVEQKST